MAEKDRRCPSAKSQMGGTRPPRARPVAIMPVVRATILAVGSELLQTERLDTNSLRLTALLERHGVELVKKCEIGDLAPEIEREMRVLWQASDLILVSGGLGPTADDLTREAAAAALGIGLAANAGALEQIERRFAAMGRRVSSNNRKQAEILVGAEVLENPNGTAPGQLFERDGKALFLFPGVSALADARAHAGPPGRRRVRRGCRDDPGVGRRGSAGEIRLDTGHG